VARFQKPGVSAATQDVVFAFINNDFRGNQARAASFKLDAVADNGKNWFGIEPTHNYNVVDIASANPANLLWGAGIMGSELIANGIYVGFQPDASFYGGQAQYIRLLDMTAGMTAASVNDMYTNAVRYAAPVIAPLSNQVVAVSNTLSFALQVTKDPADTVEVSCASTLATNHWTFAGANYLFTFTPDATELGVHTFLFTATGRDGYDEELMTITVTAQAPSTPYEQWANSVGLDPKGPNGGPNADFDGDGFTNQQEYWADTNPKDGTSFLHIQAISLDGDQVSLTLDKGFTAPRAYVIHGATEVISNAWNWSVLHTNQSTDGILLPFNSGEPVRMFKITIPAAP